MGSSVRTDGLPLKRVSRGPSFCVVLWSLNHAGRGFTMNGPQLGVGPGFSVDGYHLDLWYYGRAVMHVVNGRVWGRSLYASAPARVRWPTSAR